MYLTAGFILAMVAAGAIEWGPLWMAPVAAIAAIYMFDRARRG